MQIAGHGRRNHDAGPVVIAENKRPFERALRKHDLLRTNAPKPLPDVVRGRTGEVVGTAFDDSKKVMVVVAEYGASGQQSHIVEGREFLDGGRNPVHAGLIVNGLIFGKQAAAELVLFVGDNHSRARSRRDECGHQPRRPATGDQHVAMDVVMLVAIRIWILRRLAESRGCTNESLVPMP